MQAIPDPFRDQLERRVFKSVDVVEEVMVQRPAQILKLALQVVEMHQKAGFRIRLAFHGHAHAERVAMDPTIRMAFRR